MGNKMIGEVSLLVLFGLTCAAYCIDMVRYRAYKRKSTEEEEDS